VGSVMRRKLFRASQKGDGAGWRLPAARFHAQGTHRHEPAPRGTECRDAHGQRRSLHRQPRSRRLLSTGAMRGAQLLVQHDAERVTLSAGTRFGAYEVAAPIGAGGMGEVYRARDTRLDRDVALKILPDAFAADADRVARSSARRRRSRSSTIPTSP